MGTPLGWPVDPSVEQQASAPGGGGAAASAADQAALAGHALKASGGARSARREPSSRQRMAELGAVRGQAVSAAARGVGQQARHGYVGT
jgi:hypothetical protein